jgi:proline racemase
MARQADALRRGVMMSPRGHADILGVSLTEPVTPGAHAGLLFMDASGFPMLSGTAALGAVTVAIERQLIEAPDIERLTFDTPVGTIHARATLDEADGRRRAVSVALTSVPSFVASPGHRVSIGTRDLRVDIAFGGVFYAIVDTEAIGVPLDVSRLPELRRLAVQISTAINTSGAITHPLDRTIAGVAGVVFTGAPRDPLAHLRNVSISAGGAVDCSPSVGGTAAAMAVLDAMGLLDGDQAFVHEGLIGTLQHGRVLRRTQVGDLPSIVPEVEGSAWITGEHTFYLDAADPLREGVAL